LTGIDWQDALVDRPSRSNLSFRRRQEDREYLVRFPLGWRDGSFQLPKGLIQGQKLQQMLRMLTLRVANVEDFDHLPTRFRAVATDLETGEPMVLANGDLVSALRASLSVPGVFAPVERDGRLLVDGGVSNNLPIDVARAMGVDVLIVVDVGYPLNTRQQLNSVASVSNQMLVILMRRDAQRQRESLGPDDIVIDPQMGTLSSFDFTRLPSAIGYGDAAARAVALRLAGLSLNDADYARYVAVRSGREAPAGEGEVRFVRANSASQPFGKSIEELFGDLVGKAFDPYEVDRRIRRVYGQGILENLDYLIEPTSGIDPAIGALSGDVGLTFDAREKSWGPNYLRFGLSLQDDFSGNSTFDASARLTMTDLNRSGAEWMLDGRVGNSPHLATELYWPFSPRQRWFVLPNAIFELRNMPLGISADGAGLLHVRDVRGGIAFGRASGNATEVRAGVLLDQGSTWTRVDGVETPVEPFYARQYFVRYEVDALNDLAFPQRGGGLSLEWHRYEERTAGNVSADTVEMQWRQVYSWGRNRTALWLSAGASWDGQYLEPRNQFRLGGFMSLSGLPRDALSGPNYGIGRLIYYRQVGRGGEGILGMPLYLGMSMEMGNVWGNRREIRSTDLRTDASMFLGLDSYLGPVYLSFGYDSGGTRTVFLSVGRGF
jgi:NTE family protein